MQDEMLKPLTDIRQAAEAVLETELDDLQRNYIEATRDSARGMIELIVSFPAVEWERGREVFSYEARSHLSSIIGYAELLLDEDDGPLSEHQRVNIHRIRTAGKHLLRLILKVVD